MAAQLPAKLKAVGDVARFAQRAAQLEKVKPVIAYWCEYWIVNQIIARGLHKTDKECLEYTTNLMDKLEQIKSKYDHEDAITDDVAGQAYCEQFGLETFERAERAVKADKVTKQTADTFLAAATFLELVNIWQAPDAETLSKIKYAKWNAVRIVKAIKEGKDPNESNPKPEPEEELEDAPPPLDMNDPEVQQFTSPSSQYPPKPTVQEISDDESNATSHLAAKSMLNSSLHPSGRETPVAPAPVNTKQPAADDQYEVSPLESSPQPPSQRKASIGGGYFPSPPADLRPITPPSAPTDLPTFLPPAASARTSTAGSPPPVPHFPSHPPADISHAKPSVYDSPAIPTVAPPVVAPLPSASSHGVQASQTKFVPDDIAIAKAQKHARWAISALNFEDTDTAIRELRAAIETLGGQ